MTDKIRAAAASGGLARHADHRGESRDRARVDRGLLRRGARGARPPRGDRQGRGARRRRTRHRLLRRHGARRRARAGPRARGGDRRGRLPPGEPRRRALLRDHHAAPVRSRHRAEPGEVRPRLALCAGARGRDSRARAGGQGQRCPRAHRGRDRRRKSRGSRRGDRAGLRGHGGPGGRAVRASRAAGRRWRRRRGDARRVARPTRPQDVEAGGLCRAPREGRPGDTRSSHRAAPE